jgi:hypothetical protein
MNLLVLHTADREIVPQARPSAIALGHAAEDLFRRSGYLALRDVSCVATGGELCLRGRLPSYYLKQVAQEIATSVAGPRRVINQIEISVPARRAPVGSNRAQVRRTRPIDRNPVITSTTGVNDFPRAHEGSPRHAGLEPQAERDDRHQR